MSGTVTTSANSVSIITTLSAGTIEGLVDPETPSNPYSTYIGLYHVEVTNPDRSVTIYTDPVIVDPVAETGSWTLPPVVIWQQTTPPINGSATISIDTSAEGVYRIKTFRASNTDLNTASSGLVEVSRGSIRKIISNTTLTI